MLTACTRETEHGHPELEEQIAALEHNSDLYNLVINGYDGIPTIPRLPDHVYKEIDSGQYVFLHFDKALPEATKVLYTGRIIPGKFCKEDQDKLPPGFTHFHKAFVDSDNPQDGHGGVGGEDGYWFVHVAVAELDMPWGQVVPGRSSPARRSRSRTATPRGSDRTSCSGRGSFWAGD